MNIDILANNPSFKWYFVVAVPFLVLVLLITLALQHYSRIGPLFSSFAVEMRKCVVGIRRQRQAATGGAGFELA